MHLETFWEPLTKSYSILCLQIYTKISSLVGILANIGIGLMMMVTISALVITLKLWFVNKKKKIEQGDKEEAGVTENFLENVLKGLIGIEWVIFVIINYRLLSKWVSGHRWI